MLLVIAMLFTMMPISAFATENTGKALSEKTASESINKQAANGDENTQASVEVYLSVSHDADYLESIDNKDAIALKKIKVPYFDLALYGLEDYYFASEKYELGKLEKGTPETAKDKVTMLHLFIYAIEVYYCGVSPDEAGKGYLKEQGLLGGETLNITGYPGSMFMNDFWGMDLNLNYYLNYTYPLAAPGIGSTADQILLRDNDIVTVGHFTSWQFFTDPESIFNYIMHEGKTVTTSATQGDKLDMSVIVAGPGGDFAATGHKDVTSCPDVYYAPLDEIKSGDVTKWTEAGKADENGHFTLDTGNMKPGKYIVAIPGQYGTDIDDDICSTPGAIILDLESSEKFNDVKVSVPANTAPKFYSVKEVKDGGVVKGEALTYENGFVKVPENVSRIMWEADGLVGFSAPVKEDTELNLVKVSFSSESVDKAAVEINDSAGVKAKGSLSDTYLLPAEEGFTYKIYLDNKDYNPVELKNQTPEEGIVKVDFEKKHFTVIAPKGSVVSAGTLTGSFKYSFAEPISQTTEGETVVYKFAPLKFNAFVRVQRPDDKDAVTYWDWKSAKTEGKTITVTEKELFMNDSGSDKFDADTVYRNFEKYEMDLGDIYMNINNKGYINLDAGETKGLDMFRNWQVIESFMNQNISLPDFSYEIIDVDGKDVISIDPDKNNSAAATLTAKNKGTAIVLVKYDAMYSDSTAGTSGGAGGGNRLSAIWPDRTGVFVVSVGKDGTNIKSNMECNGSVFDAEHSPQFYTGTEGASVSFKPDNGVDVTVNRSTVGKDGLFFDKFTKGGVKVAKDGTVTVSGLKTGRHIIRLEKDGVSSYQVVTAQETNVKILDGKGKDMSDNPVFTPGEKITLKIKGLTNPAEKFATKYNFNAQLLYKDQKGNSYKNSSGTVYGKYNFSSQEQVVVIQIPDDWKDEKFTLNGAIQMGGFAGDGIGSHRKVTYGAASGMAHGTPPGMVLGTLPEITLLNRDHKHIFDKEVVDDKYFAGEADFNHGKAYYKSCSCGKAGTEKFYVGESLGAPIKAAAKEELEKYKNPADYREAQQIELADQIKAGKEAIDNAKSPEEVSQALEAAKEEIDKIKTDAQLEAEEAKVKNGWEKKDGKWYFYEKGEKKTGWVKDNNHWYHMDKEGVMDTGWLKDNGYWYFLNPGGSMKTGWAKIDGIWYYFNPGGSMKTGWHKINEKYYFFYPCGSMAEDEIVNGWYLGKSGAWVTGDWHKNSIGWWYGKGDGSYPRNGFVKIGGGTFKFDKNGYMETGWVKSGGKWYYMNKAGYMQHDGWQKIGKTWYYFHSDGHMAADETIDGWHLDRSGAGSKVA